MADADRTGTSPKDDPKSPNSKKPSRLPNARVCVGLGVLLGGAFGWLQGLKSLDGNFILAGVVGGAATGFFVYIVLSLAFRRGKPGFRLLQLFFVAAVVVVFCHESYHVMNIGSDEGVYNAGAVLANVGDHDYSRGGMKASLKEVQEQLEYFSDGKLRWLLREDVLQRNQRGLRLIGFMTSDDLAAELDLTDDLRTWLAEVGLKELLTSDKLALRALSNPVLSALGRAILYEAYEEMGREDKETWVVKYFRLMPKLPN